MRATEWRIVWVDQEPLRSELAAECGAAMAHLERVRNQWHHFERKDKPAFIRWRAREFGSLLSDAREVEQKIQQARELIHEVEQELRRYFQTPASAYARVMFRRQNPGLVEPEPEVSGGASRALTEFEQEALFQNWVKKFLGTDPDKMDDEAYRSSFENFKTHMFTTAAPSPAPRTKRAEVSLPLAEEAEEKDGAVDERVKTLYRRLVRHLHPDARRDGSVEVSVLWHEVQEAYASSDVARMELLLALSHFKADSQFGQRPGVGDLRSLLHELRRSLRALEKSVAEAENDEAWDFARTGPTTGLREEVKRQLEFALSSRSCYLNSLQDTIAKWQNLGSASSS